MYSTKIWWILSIFRLLGDLQETWVLSSPEDGLTAEIYWEYIYFCGWHRVYKLFCTYYCLLFANVLSNIPNQSLFRHAVSTSFDSVYLSDPTIPEFLKFRILGLQNRLGTSIRFRNYTALEQTVNGTIRICIRIFSDTWNLSGTGLQL